VTSDGNHHLVETKGLEDVNVSSKSRAARLWCENASVLTGTPWSYLIVRQSDYQGLQPTEFSDLDALSSQEF
jgi:type III restriction enzyme